MASSQSKTAIYLFSIILIHFPVNSILGVTDTLEIKNSSQSTFHIGNKIFVLKNGFYKGWYRGKYLCSEEGLQLASVNKDKVWELSQQINSRFPEVHSVWVGLRRSEYRLDQASNGDDIINYISVYIYSGKLEKKLKS